MLEYLIYSLSQFYILALSYQRQSPPHLGRIYYVFEGNNTVTWNDMQSHRCRSASQFWPKVFDLKSWICLSFHRCGRIYSVFPASLLFSFSISCSCSFLLFICVTLGKYMQLRRMEFGLQIAPTKTQTKVSAKSNFILSHGFVHPMDKHTKNKERSTPLELKVSR